MSLEANEVRDLGLSAFEYVLQQLDPRQLTAHALTSNQPPGSVAILALGKAAVAMAMGASGGLGTKLVSGLVIGYRPAALPPPLELLVGSHPLPNAASVAAGEAAIRFVSNLDPGTHLVFLISGGGSALAEVPLPGVEIELMASVGEQLLRSGASIADINLVRRHLSAIKNGGLLRAATPTATRTLVLSDVVDGPASQVASGPTMADGSRPRDAQRVLDSWLASVPDSIRRALDREPEEPRGEATVLAESEDVANSARESLLTTGAPVEVWTTALRGEASRMGPSMVAATPPGAFLVAAGEVTVSGITGGEGGRNQEAALAVVTSGLDGVFLALGTDGIDGPTNAAGAIVDTGSATRMRGAGVDPERSLARHDSGPALGSSGDLVITGATGNNLGDLWISWRPRYPDEP